MNSWFDDAALGIFIHWGIYSVKPTLESWPIFNKTITREDYYSQCDGFTASKWNPQTLAKLISNSGADYAVMTTRHHDGVSLWPSKQHKAFNAIDHTPVNIDLISGYCDALRAKNIKVGLYYSLSDWRHPDYPTVCRDAQPNNEGDYLYEVVEPVSKENENLTAWQRYLEYCHGQIRELCANYQPDLLWFDGDWERTDEQWQTKDIRQMIANILPETVVNSRLGNDGDYETPEQAIPIIPPIGSWEFCMTMNDHWGYMDSDNNYKSPREIIYYLMNCRSKGGRLLLGIGPKADGTFVEQQLTRLDEVGQWVKRNSVALKSVSRGLPSGHYNGVSTIAKDNRTIYLYLDNLTTESIAISGLKSTIASISILGHNNTISHRIVGGAEWKDLPGVLWMNIESVDNIAQPELGVIIKIQLVARLELYRETGEKLDLN